MSAVTFFGEVRDLTSRAVDDSDEEDELLTSLHVDIVFKPDDVQLPVGQKLFVSVTDRLPAGLTVLCDITADSGSGFTSRLVQLDDNQIWLAVKFTSHLLSDSWQTVAIAGSVMRKLEAAVSETVVLLVDRTVNSLQQICTHVVSDASDYGAKRAAVPKTVSSTFETAVFEWAVVRSAAARILLIPGTDYIPAALPVVLSSGLRGLRLSVSDSNMFI